MALVGRVDAVETLEDRARPEADRAGAVRLVFTVVLVDEDTPVGVLDTARFEFGVLTDAAERDAAIAEWVEAAAAVHDAIADARRQVGRLIRRRGAPPREG